MCIAAVSVIDIDEGDSAFSVLDEALGKLGPDPLEVRIQDDLKAAIARKAKQDGFRNSSEAVRYVLAKWALGEEQVESLITSVLSRYGIAGAAHAPSVVPTAPGQGSSN